MFHSMKYILAVYEAQGFTKAAENLGISQPSLSASVKNIEAEVGTPLFERGFHPPRIKGMFIIGFKLICFFARH